jgi:hypothetical protein
MSRSALWGRVRIMILLMIVCSVGLSLVAASLMLGGEGRREHFSGSGSGAAAHNVSPGCPDGADDHGDADGDAMPQACRDMPRAARFPGRVDDNAAEYEQGPEDARDPVPPTFPPRGVQGKATQDAGPWPHATAVKPPRDYCRRGSGVPLPQDALAISQRYRQIEDLWLACGRTLANALPGTKSKKGPCADGLRRGDPRVVF